MIDEYQIRTALPEDVIALARLGADTFIKAFGHLYAPEDLQLFVQENHSVKVYSNLLKNSDYQVWLGLTGEGAPVGYAVGGICTLPVEDMPPRSGEVKRLYMDSAYQSAGLGRRLMDEMMTWFEREKYAPLYLSVYAENHGAQRFYARYGFEKIKEYEFAVGNHMDPELIFQRG